MDTALGAHELSRGRGRAALPTASSTLGWHADPTEIVQGHGDLVHVAADLVTEMAYRLARAAARS